LLDVKVLKEKEELDTDLSGTPEKDAQSDPDTAILLEAGAIILGVTAKLLYYWVLTEGRMTPEVVKRELERSSLMRI
jgi:hypothetical protein